MRDPKGNKSSRDSNPANGHVSADVPPVQRGSGWQSLITAATGGHSPPSCHTPGKQKFGGIYAVSFWDLKFHSLISHAGTEQELPALTRACPQEERDEVLPLLAAWCPGSHSVSRHRSD